MLTKLVGQDKIYKICDMVHRRAYLSVRIKTFVDDIMPIRDAGFNIYILMEAVTNAS
jgi:hypothetical protein